MTGVDNADGERLTIRAAGTDQFGNRMSQRGGYWHEHSWNGRYEKRKGDDADSAVSFAVFRTVDGHETDDEEVVYDEYYS